MITQKAHETDDWSRSLEVASHSYCGFLKVLSFGPADLHINNVGLDVSRVTLWYKEEAKTAVKQMSAWKKVNIDSRLSHPN